ncbi:MAG: glutamate--tRNA ligase, partial [Burkholderiales bacterium]|nr:glutamate--tRNA ligase [Burkholderiales bacterium]
MIVTRFAPSPTGFLHIGGARTALFSWAYAKKNNGKFILRVEDTDIERSTQKSVDSILDAMHWLGLNCDEGPYFQTHRMDNYKALVKKLLDESKAYYCYCSKEKLDEMRDVQRQNGLKPKYDRRCLHNPIKKDGVLPVVRFKNPDSGSVIWNDMVKGRIDIRNEELDDLIIARSDGTPTYNFCVVIDDLEMNITHVIRGDDHVNNTPRQINI